MINWRDIAIRSGKTFVATFLPLITAASQADLGDAKWWGAAALSAASAAITAIWNAGLQVKVVRAAEKAVSNGLETVDPRDFLE